MSTDILAIILIFIQLVAIIAHGTVLLQYRKYCKHCEWWSDLGATIFFLWTFVPIVGITASIVGPIDYCRNIFETYAK